MHSLVPAVHSVRVQSHGSGRTWKCPAGRRGKWKRPAGRDNTQGLCLKSRRTREFALRLQEAGDAFHRRAGSAVIS